CCCRATRGMPSDHVCDARSEALCIVDVQELVRTVRVRVRSEYARHQELRTRKSLPQHGHEGNRSAHSHHHAFSAEEIMRGFLDRFLEPTLERGSVPAGAAGARGEA